jgi:hypothetical protein
LTENRCPECGTPFNPFAAPQARIPWLRRAKIGIGAGLMQTMFLVILRPGTLAREITCTSAIDRISASKFKWMAIAFGCAGSGAMILLFMILLPMLHPHARNLSEPGWRDIAMLLVGLFAMVIYFGLVGEIPLVPPVGTDFPPRYHNVLQKYSIAPVMLSPMATVTLLVAPEPTTPWVFFLLVAVMWWVPLRILWVSGASILDVIFGVFLLTVWWAAVGWVLALLAMSVILRLG